MTTVTESAERIYEPFEPHFQLNPYPALARIRGEAAAVRAQHPEHGEIWMVARHGLVRQIHSDPIWIKPPEENDDGIASFDSAPPDHTRLRGLVQSAFTTRRVGQFRSFATSISEQLLDGIAERGSSELITEYADLVPIEVIRTMCGLPQEYTDELKELMHCFLGGTDAEYQWRVFGRAEEYVTRLLEEKTAHPGDDLTTDLLQATSGSDRLSRRELVRVLTIILVNGAATTTNVIGTGVDALLDNPDQFALLRARPDLVKSAAEEMLRYECPVGGLGWTPIEDVDLDGVVIRAGEVVATSLQSANRDPAEFPDPDRFDITRHPNHHLTFSSGIHRCLGAELSRMELQVAVGALVARFPGLRRLAPATWRKSYVVRGLTELRVAV